MTEEKTLYEMMAIVMPDLGEQQTEKEIAEIKKLITASEGEITHEDIWGLRPLAYRIRKQESGFYIVINFLMDALKLKELYRPLTISPNILRYLIIKTEKGYEIKTLADYEKEKAKEEEEKKMKEKEEEEEKETKKKIVKKEEPKKVEKIEEKVEKKVEEKIEEKAEEKVKKEPSKKKEEKPKKETKSKLDEVDEKLRSIINDPDISL